MKCSKCGKEFNGVNVCPNCGTKKNKNRNLKLFAIFLIVVIILVTVYILVKRDNDIEKGITPSNIPNQANVK